MMHSVATTGSPAMSQPANPAPARASIATSARPNPPVPWRTASASTMAVSITWTASITRLQRGPSAACATNAPAASTVHTSHVPRCGRVVPRRMSRM